jgi:hypothetical protein
MSQKIGPREQALRDQREREAKEQPPAAKARADLAAKLPETSGIKPVKRKAKKRSRR